MNRPFLALAGLGLLASCLPGLSPPHAPQRSALSLEMEPKAPGASAAVGPLAVVFATPQGDTTVEPEIAVMFNKPMRPLGLAASDASPPAVLDPPAKGTFHWLGSSGLRFDAEEALPLATRYRVQIPKSSRALDGSTLATPFEFVFNTARPTVSITTPEADDGEPGPDTQVALSFNMKVSEAEILRTLSVRPGVTGAPIPFHFVDRKGVERGSADATGQYHFTLAPTTPLPLATDIHVKVDGSLRGEVGELGAGKDQEVVFNTARPPSVKTVECKPHPLDPDACTPDAAEIRVEASTRLTEKAFARAVVIEPSLAWDDSGYRDRDYSTDKLFIRAPFKPGTTYRIRVDPSRGGKDLVNEYGQRLVGGREHVFRFGAREPAVRLGIRGSILSPRDVRPLPVELVNVNNVDLWATKLSLDDVIGPRPKSTTTRGPGFRIDLGEPTLNVSQSTSVDLDKLLSTKVDRGPMLLDARYQRRGDSAFQHETHEAQLTDLAITARVAWGSAVVLVTSLDDGAPVPNAEVFVYRVADEKAAIPSRFVGRALADATGLATVSMDERADIDGTLAVIAKRGSDWTYRTVSGPNAPTRFGMLYTDRNLYRPGETVQVSGILRVPTATGLRTASGENVSLTLLGPGDMKMAGPTVSLSSFGTFSASIILPKDAALDYYAVTTGGNDRIYANFRVLEYRPTELSAEATVDRAEHVRGDSLVCMATGRYLYGAPMGGGRVVVTTTRRRAYFSVPGLESLHITKEPENDPPQQLTRGIKTLDAKGTVALKVPLTAPDQGVPEWRNCTFEFRDKNHQTLTAAAETLVHPGEVYVALQDTSEGPLVPGGRVQVQVLAVTPLGERRAMPVHVDVLRRQRDNTAAEIKLGSCDVTTGAKPVPCSVAIPRGTPTSDTRVVVRARTVDAPGNPIEAGYSEAVVEPPKPDPPSRPEPPQQPTPYFKVTTAQHYAVGDTGHVTINWPFALPATALFTVEREGVLWHERLSLTGPTTDVPFAVTREMLPNAQVQMTVISGRDAREASTDFSVDPAPQRLRIVLDTKGEAHAPGEELTVGVRVEDAKGKPARAEVTVFAVDEATLSLGFYHLRDPVEVLFANRWNFHPRIESRDDLARIGRFFSHSRRTRPPSVRMGSTNVSDRPLRHDFRQTAFYEAHLVTDTEGRVQRRVRLPDGLTTYRVMAVAVTEDDRAGISETKLQTSLPLMARATLPRAIRVGDHFDASVVVSTKGLPSGDVDVTAAAEGLTLPAKAARRVRVDPDKPIEVRFPVRADRAGPSRITFKASVVGGNGTAGDAVTLTQEVRTPLVPESAALDGETRSAIAEQLGDLRAMQPDYGGLTVTLSPTPLAGLGAGIEQLIDYPYGCTEQLVSRLVPLLPLRELARALGVALPADTAFAVKDAVSRVIANQHKDGGFGLWPESRASDANVSAYALSGLLVAQRHGVDVPSNAVRDARDYLAKAIHQGAQGESDATLDLAAFVADLAAESKAPDAPLVARLFDARDRLSPSSRAMLLHAIATGGHDVARERALARGLEAMLRLDGNMACVVSARESPPRPFESDTRSTALVLRALVASEPDHPLIPKLVRGILGARRNGRFRTTHETAWALIALDAVRRLEHASTDKHDGRVFLGQTRIAEVTFEKARTPLLLQVPMANLVANAGQPLTFEALGGGSLHYEARLRFTRRDLPTAPVDAGFFLRRTAITLPDPGFRAPQPASTFATGDLVAVSLDVVTPSPRDFVVLESPLPGGFEPVATDLRMAGAWLRFLERDGGPGAATRRELRDDRVVYFIDHLPAGVSRYRYIARAATKGTFVTPPSHIEEMYAPETMGRTARETTIIEAGDPN